MKKEESKVIKALLKLIFFFGLLTIIANLVVDTPYFHSFIKKTVNHSLKELGISVKFQDISLSVVPLGADIYDVSVISIDQKKEVDLLKSTHLKARVSLFSLFIGRPKLSLIQIESPVLSDHAQKKYLNPTPSSKENTTSKKNETITWPPENLPHFLETIRINNFDFAYHPPGSSLEVDARSLSTEIEIANWNSINIKANARNFTLIADNNFLVENSSFKLNGHFGGTTLNLENIFLESSKLTSYTTATLSFPFNGNGFNATITSNSKGDLSALGAALDFPNTYGNFQANTVTTLDLRDEFKFDVEGSATFNDGIFYGYRLFNSGLNFSLNEKRMNFEQAIITINNKEYARASGTLNFSKKVAFDFQIKPNRLHYIDLMRIIDVDFEEFDFKITSDDLAIKGEGSPFWMSIESKAQVEDIYIPKLDYTRANITQSPRCEFNVDISIDSSHMEFKENTLRCQPKSPNSQPTFQSQLQLNGPIYFDESGLNLQISSENLDLEIAEYFANIDMDGYSSFETAIHGPYNNIEIISKLDAHSVALFDYPLERVEATVRVVDENVVIDELRTFRNDRPTLNVVNSSLNYNNLVADVSGSLSKLDRIYIARLLPKLKNYMDFNIDRLDFNVRGKVTEPHAWIGSFRSTVSNYYLDNELLFDKGTSHLKLTPGKYQLEIKSLTKESINFGGSVSLSKVHQNTHNSELYKLTHLNDASKLKINVKTINSPLSKKFTNKLRKENQISQIPYLSPALKGMGLSGKIDLSVNIEGTLDSFQGTIGGSLQNAKINQTKIPDLKLSGFVDDSKVDTTLELTDNTLKGRLSMDVLSDGVPYEWYFNFNQFDVRSMIGDFYAKDPRNYAYLTGDWSSTGIFTDWWKSEAKINIKNIQMNYAHTSELKTGKVLLVTKSPTSLEVKNGHLRFTSDVPLILESEDMSFVLNTHNTRLPEELDIGINGNVNANIFNQFTNQIENASGSLDLELKLTGPISDPVSHTTIATNPKVPMTIGLAELKPAFTNIETSISIHNRKISVDRLSANKGTGSIHANGEVYFDGKTSTNLEFEMDGPSFIFKLPAIQQVEATTKGRLYLAGSQLPLLLSGNIDIERARTARNVDFRNQLVKLIGQKSVQTTSTEKDPILNFNLTVSADKSINIRNRSMQMDLSADLEIGGDNNKPQVLGNIEIVEGKFIYKRDFNFLRGVITFDDPINIDPSLHMLAVAEVDPYKIFIDVSGKATDPVVEFTVDPPIREDGSPLTKFDTLVLLTKGSLPSNQSVVDAQSVAGTEGLNIVSGQFQQPLEKLFEMSGQKIIRNVYLGFYASEKDGSPKLRAQMPLNLSDELDLVVKRDEDAWGIIAEYPLDPNLSITGKFNQLLDDNEEASGDSSTEKGVDVKFRFSIP